MPDAQLPYLIDITALAEHLGVPVRHIRQLVADRRIPFHKWGHLIRFDAAEVGAWLAQHRFPAENAGVPLAPGTMAGLPRGARRRSGVQHDDKRAGGRRRRA